MSGKAKKVALWVAVAFVAFAIITQPVESAAAVRGIWNIVWMALGALGVFFSTLLK